jgi:hypothetical protein
MLVAFLLTRPQKDYIISTCTLCREHEKSGFVEGVKVGIRLAQELV